MLIGICCLYSRIKIVIKIMETSADFVTEVCTVMLVPPIMMIILFVWTTIWLFLSFYVYANGDIAQAEPAEGELYGKPYGNVTWTEEAKRMWYYFCFGYLWISFFIDAMN